MTTTEKHKESCTNFNKMIINNPIYKLCRFWGYDKEGQKILGQNYLQGQGFFGAIYEFDLKKMVMFRAT